MSDISIRAHFDGKQIVLAADRHPSQLDGVVDRLRSRFESGLVVDVQTPQLETRIAILRMWAQERNIQLPSSVCELLATRAKLSIRELELGQAARLVLGGFGFAIQEGGSRQRNEQREQNAEDEEPALTLYGGAGRSI